MLIYNYNKATKEYLYSQEAEADPAETKLKGKFVPLVPANATLIKPPEYGENEIPVFLSGIWEVKADYRKNYKKVDNNLNISDITTIGEIEDGYYLVDYETAELIQEDSSKFKIENGEIVQKTEEEIALENEAKEQSEVITAEERETLFYEEFFSTSLGYIRRKAAMKTGETKDFLSDLLPVISFAVQAGQDVTIITYTLPDFSQELTTEYMESLQETKTATAEFIQECFLQLSNDFSG